MAYAWVCDCGEQFPVEQSGYNAAQNHQRSEHEGASGVILGVMDTDSGELVVSGFGPRVLKKAQDEGYITRKSTKKEPGGGSKGGGGSGDASDRGTRNSDVGIRTKQTYRQVWLDLPLLESLFQRSRVTFAEDYPDSDDGFSSWLHDVIIHSLRPYAMTLFGLAPAAVEQGAQQAAVSREELAQLLMDPSVILDSEMPRIIGVMYEAAAWGSLVGPHFQRRGRIAS